MPAAEAGIATALTGLALFSIGDASSAVQFQRALQLNAPAGAAQFLLGARRAMQGARPRRDRRVAGGDRGRNARRSPAVADRGAICGGDDLRERARRTGAGQRPASAAWTRVGRGHAHRQPAATPRPSRCLTPSCATARRSGSAMAAAARALCAVRARRRSATAADAERFATQARAYIDARALMARSPKIGCADEINNKNRIVDLAFVLVSLFLPCLQMAAAPAACPGVFSEYSRARRHRHVRPVDLHLERARVRFVGSGFDE